MKVSDYLKEIEHAVQTVISEIHREHDRLAELQAEIGRLTKEASDGYQRANFSAMNPDIDDDDLGTAVYWETYFGADKARFYKDKDAEELAAKVAAHELSVAALAGSLLQYAKQGLSLRFGSKRKGIPSGRKIHGVESHELIWQGRNQAIHWEEGSFHPPTEKLFKTLATADAVFADYTHRSMAYECVRLLDWKTFADFRADMMVFDV